MTTKHPPELSITGGKVIKKVSKRILENLYSSFTKNGATHHSAEASLVWHVTEMLKEKGEAFKVVVMRTIDGKPCAVAVMKPEEKSTTDSHDYTMEVVESWKPQ